MEKKTNSQIESFLSRSEMVTLIHERNWLNIYSYTFIYVIHANVLAHIINTSFLKNGTQVNVFKKHSCLQHARQWGFASNCTPNYTEATASVALVLAMAPLQQSPKDFPMGMPFSKLKMACTLTNMKFQAWRKTCCLIHNARWPWKREMYATGHRHLYGPESLTSQPLW